MALTYEFYVYLFWILLGGIITDLGYAGAGIVIVGVCSCLAGMCLMYEKYNQ